MEQRDFSDDWIQTVDNWFRQHQLNQFDLLEPGPTTVFVIWNVKMTVNYIIFHIM